MMIEKIQSKTLQYIKENAREKRKEKGQFFTAATTARYMASMIDKHRDAASVLDAGAGNGMLAAAVVERLAENGCGHIELCLVENDPDVLPLLTESMEMIRDFCERKGIAFSCNIRNANFLTAEIGNDFDVVVSNPPYKKIPKNAVESTRMSRYVHGQPNLYGLFMCKATEALKQGGDFIFITPRSWTSGEYFERMRLHLIDNIGFDRFHLFNSRTDSFSNESVLQETLIVHGIKGKSSKDVEISTSTADDFADLNRITVASQLCIGVSPKKYVLIPASASDAKNLKAMRTYDHTLSSLGYRFKTGPVVEFRAEESLRYKGDGKSIPMIRSQHIKEAAFVFPDESVDKAQYFNTDKKNYLINNRTTVFLKRITTKEDNRRLQACVYTPRANFGSFITAENHVNYLVKDNGEEITATEAEHICRILNSESAETYFRALNGSTQINASEINDFPIKEEIL